MRVNEWSHKGKGWEYILVRDGIKYKARFSLDGLLFYIDIDNCETPEMAVQSMKDKLTQLNIRITKFVETDNSVFKVEK